MSNLPSISVITPTFNASKTIRACLDSVAQQNYPHLEHWIIDGESTDDTLDIVKEYAQKYPHIHYVSGKDKGIYDAMNKGIDLASGDFLFFLGADDCLVPGLLHSIFQEVAWDNYQLIYGKVRGREFSETKGQAFSMQDIERGMGVPHQASFIHKSLFRKLGYYTLKYPVAADAHFFIKVFGDKTINTLFIDKVFAIIGEAGFSAQQVDNQFRKDYPALVKRYLGVDLDIKKYSRGIAAYHFDQIYRGQLWKGLGGILFLSMKTGEFGFYLKNAIYWLNQRRKKKSSYSE
ncbi:MAG: PGL/p-HBAD biosynthesis glycosyltransferase [Patescibacteria group bacterium]|nr:MAG: PGL/p-HBAD biosynthesis glycosyltransferase [Patescibacteria group bacterium]